MAPVCAVVVAGGSGQRFGNPGGKQLVNVAGRPLMSWSIRAFDRSDKVGHIVVVCPAERRAEMRRLAIDPFDYDTPIEETMEALNDLVKAGKVRALGASAMHGYQFYNMQLAARDHGWAQFQAMENHYNLLYREDERELIPICKQMGVSLMPYSPLAAGHLTRPQWNTDTLRSQTDRVAMGKYDRTEEQDMQIVLRVQELAERYGVKMQQIALAWHWAKGVAAPIVGATKARYLDDAADALAVTLTAEDIAYLEEPYLPHRVVGAIDHNPADGVMLLDEKK